MDSCSSLVILKVIVLLPSGVLVLNADYRGFSDIVGSISLLFYVLLRGSLLILNLIIEINVCFILK